MICGSHNWSGRWGDTEIYLPGLESNNEFSDTKQVEMPLCRLSGQCRKL